jgi:hypothetical protein
MFSAQQAFSGSQFRISGCCLLVIRISSTDFAGFPNGNKKLPYLFRNSLAKLDNLS